MLLVIRDPQWTFCSQKSQNNRKKFFNQKRIFEKQSPKIETGKKKFKKSNVKIFGEHFWSKFSEIWGRGARILLLGHAVVPLNLERLFFKNSFLMENFILLFIEGLGLLVASSAYIALRAGEQLFIFDYFFFSKNWN